MNGSRIRNTRRREVEITTIIRIHNSGSSPFLLVMITSLCRTPAWMCGVKVLRLHANSNLEQDNTALCLIIAFYIERVPYGVLFHTKVATSLNL